MQCKYCNGEGRIVLAKSQTEPTKTIKALTMDCSKCNGTGFTLTWYEVFIDKLEDGTETILKTNDKMEAVRFAAENTKVDGYAVHVDRWELDEDKTPHPVEQLF